MTDLLSRRLALLGLGSQLALLGLLVRQLAFLGLLGRQLALNTWAGQSACFTCVHVPGRDIALALVGGHSGGDNAL